MYTQLAQHQAAGDQFNRGLGLLAASAFPGRRPDLIMNAMSGGNGPDAGSLFSNMMAIQNWQQQQQRYQAVLSSIPKMAEKLGIDPSILTTMAQADPENFGRSLGQIEMARAGLTGNLTDKEYNQAKQNFQTQHPGETLPAELQSEAAFAQQQGQNIVTANATAKDLVADKANFQPALQGYDKAIGLIDQLQTPAMQAGLKEFLGTTGSMRPVATMSANGKAAWALYKQVMAMQFAAGTQDFKGAGRITQQELNQDAPSQSTMGQLNQDPEDFMKGMGAYRNQLATHRANLFGKAGQLDDPALGDQDYGLISPIYKPGGDLFVAGQKGRSAAASPTSSAPIASVKTPEDVAKLPKGTKFVIPDGSGRIGIAPGS
jgi:hypothetical protein